jgi:hypothetical protein
MDTSSVTYKSWRGKCSEYLKRINIKKLFIGQPKFGTVSSKPLTQSWGSLLGEEGEQVAGGKAQESVDENCECPIAFLILIPGCETLNNDNTENG